MKPILIILLLFFVTPLFCQSGLVIHGGLSINRADKSHLPLKDEYLSGWNLGLTSRFGKDFWYFKTGLEFQKIQLKPSKNITPFAPDPGFSFLFIPAQLGARIIKSEIFLLRLFAGVYGSYLLQIDENQLDLNHNTLTDFQFGAGGGVGFDLGPLAIDLSYNYGLSTLYKSNNNSLRSTQATIGFFF